MESRMLLIPQTRWVENTCASRIYILCLRVPKTQWYSIATVKWWYTNHVHSCNCFYFVITDFVYNSVAILALVMCDWVTLRRGHYLIGRLLNEFQTDVLENRQAKQKLQTVLFSFWGYRGQVLTDAAIPALGTATVIGLWWFSQIVLAVLYGRFYILWYLNVTTHTFYTSPYICHSWKHTDNVAAVSAVIVATLVKQEAKLSLG